jgi:hypothetical protein
MSFSMTAPKSLRQLFEQLELTEVPSPDGTVTMVMPVDERTVSVECGLDARLFAERVPVIHVRRTI